MKKIKLFIILLFISILCISCTVTEEGTMGMITYERVYMNRLETIIVMAPDSVGNVSVQKYENIRLRDIHINENNSVSFPDSADHYITFVNCPMVIIH